MSTPAPSMSWRHRETLSISRPNGHRRTRLAVEVLDLPEPTLEAEPVGDAIGIVDLGDVSAGVRMITDPALFGNEPDWSPDGDVLVYAEQARRFEANTVIHDQPRRHRANPDHMVASGSAVQPAFFPDGSRIIYSYLKSAAAEVNERRHHRQDRSSDGHADRVLRNSRQICEPT